MLLHDLNHVDWIEVDSAFGLAVSLNHEGKNSGHLQGRLRDIQLSFLTLLYVLD